MVPYLIILLPQSEASGSVYSLSNSFVLLTLILFLVSVTLWYILGRNKKKQERIIQQKDAELKKLKRELDLEYANRHLLQSEVGRTSTKLDQLDEFKEALEHLVGHDLKNVLNSAIGLSTKVHKDTQKAIESCGRLALSMIGNMMDVSRFEEEGVTLRPRHHCIREILVEAHSQVQFLFMIKRLHLQIDVPEGILVLLDKELMSRVIVNILVNAIKYSKVGDTVTIGVRKVVSADGKAMTEIFIEDEGNGIGELKLSQLFDRYWSPDDEKRGKMASAGLGLVFCKQVLTAHQGQIQATSVAGSGTRFTMTLPFSSLAVEDCDVRNQSLSTPNSQMSIPLNQLRLLQKHGRNLHSLKVYEITKIRQVIDRFSALNIQNSWTGELELAVYQGNQKKYDKLMEMLR